jgi:hypothetical protein
MKELDVELVIAKATEKHPGVTPRIISDNGPQFIAKDFKEIRSPVRTDACAHQSLLSAEQRQAGTLAWITQERMHPSRIACYQGGSRETHCEVRDLLQHRPIAQRDGIHHSSRLPCGTQSGDWRRTRSQAGSGSQIASRETSCSKTSCLASWKRLQRIDLHEG